MDQDLVKQIDSLNDECDKKYITAFYKNTKNVEYTSLLSKDEIDFLETILSKDQETLIYLFESVKSIVTNKCVDTHHIPTMLLIISKIYKDYTSNHVGKDIHWISIIRFTLDTILDADVFYIPKIESFLLKKVIDHSLELLELNLPNLVKIDKEICCSSWLFGKPLFSYDSASRENAPQTTFSP